MLLLLLIFSSSISIIIRTFAHSFIHLFMFFISILRYAMLCFLNLKIKYKKTNTHAMPIHASLARLLAFPISIPKYQPLHMYKTPQANTNRSKAPRNASTQPMPMPKAPCIPKRSFCLNRNHNPKTPFSRRKKIIA
jgi:hypothetical protein